MQTKGLKQTVVWARLMKWFKDEPNRFWYSVLALGILLSIISTIVSDAGLDSHVKAAYIEVEGGYALDWGDTRLSDPTASEPDDAKVVTGFTSGFSTLTGLIFFLLFIGLTARYDLKIAALIAINPALIFAIGRGYQEPIIMILFAIVAMAFIMRSGQKSNIAWKLVAFVAFTGIIAVKGYSLHPILMVLALIMAGSAYIPDRFFRPKRMLVGGFAGGISMVLVMGILGIGTPKVIIDEPIRFLYSVPFAFVDVIIIYGLFAMVLWPIAKSAWVKMADINDRRVGELALMVGSMAGFITMYVAVLWAYESILWNSEWPWHMAIMGNNGRYITIILFPAYLIVKWIDPQIDWNQKRAIIGIMLILPFSLIAGLHGQSYWTDEAAEGMDLEMGEHFLFVSDGTLGMHYLYTFHQPLDAAKMNITGHWRSDEADWQNQLNMELNHIDWIVLAPEITESPDGWTLENSGKADIFNGGGQWRVFTRS